MFYCTAIVFKISGRSGGGVGVGGGGKAENNLRILGFLYNWNGWPSNSLN